ncbi:hypothetical protein JANAI62_14620 [Jannaschia pagri]|uniref:Arginine transporter n=1 Tax=Jannaschia pagri TaxID=2829797 RepID=A0ABQ4NK99_9RHOB|nr:MULTISPECIES: hypothetical protein [unclassified Jannaschia]GIT91007.1 hypothetical protein JANAI61_14650 [Jannaschia sp. AI_61]GIT94839.1 hypothetical protein JANAI62_14620 [Jannaschia sp. AI_62]
MTPIKLSLALAAVLALSACGGGGGRGGDVTQSRPYATGPVQAACLKADRRAASRSLCGCVQATANQTLTRRERARAVKFFRDPHLAQVTRQSDRPADERFWPRYKRFVAVAERACR